MARPRGANRVSPRSPLLSCLRGTLPVPPMPPPPRSWGGGAPMIAAVDAQNLVDALGLGAVYALMAIGIGLVFGVLRLVNFAYGQLIMAGAMTLAYASRAGWSTSASILACFGVVIALSVLMEYTVFRPLRTQSPAVMLVATFAVSFLLQAIAL